MREQTVLVEFMRPGPRTNVTRRQAGRTQVVDARELGGDLRWLAKLVPALIVAMGPRR